MIKILRYLLLDKGALQGVVDVEIEKWGNFQIFGISIFRKNDKRWISFPSRKDNTPDSDGRPKYYPFMRFGDKEWHSRFQSGVLLSLDKWLADGNLPESRKGRTDTNEIDGSPTSEKHEDVPF